MAANWTVIATPVQVREVDATTTMLLMVEFSTK